MAILIIIAQNLEEGDSRGDFLISSTLFFVVFFALGNGSIPWLIVGEMFTQGEAEHIIGTTSSPIVVITANHNVTVCTFRLEICDHLSVRVYKLVI